MRSPEQSRFRGRRFTDAISRWNLSGSRPPQTVTLADPQLTRGAGPVPGGGVDPFADLLHGETGPIDDRRRGPITMSVSVGALVAEDGGSVRWPTDPPAGQRLALLAPAAASADLDVQDPELEEPNIALELPPAGYDGRYADGPGTGRGLPRLPTPRPMPTTTSTQPLPQVGTTRPRVSIVIPTYNEAKNLPHVMARIPADVHEVIVVDGHSVDDTVEVARLLRPDVRIVMQNRKGKGNAMACGFAEVTGDIVVMLDADGSADPLEIPQFVEALVAGADFAKGTRFAGMGGSSDITRVRAWGNRWLNRVVNALYATDYTDLCYGYNAFWRSCLDHLQLDPGPRGCDKKLWGDGFEIETIINTRVAKARLRIAEVPSFEHPRVYGESNLDTWRDGGRVLRALIVERVNGVAVRPRARRRGAVTAGHATLAEAEQ